MADDDNTGGPVQLYAIWDARDAERSKARQRPATNGSSAPLGLNVAYLEKAVADEVAALRSMSPTSHNRNNQLNTSAFNLGQLVGGGELAEQYVGDVLWRTAQEIGLPDWEIEKTLRSGLEGGKAQPRHAPPPLPEIPKLSDVSAQLPDPERPADERTSWWPKPITERVAEFRSTPDPTHLKREDGKHLLYSARVNGIIGESESGKSWIALLVVTQALAKVERVLYLDFEDSPDGIYERLQLLGVDEDKLGLVHYANPEEALTLSQRSDLLEALAIGYSVIVVDGVNAAMTLMGYDLQSNTDATIFATSLLRPLAASGACVIAVDHVPKNPDTRGKGGIGAQAKRAMITGCQLRAEITDPFGVGQDGSIRLLVDKDRSGKVRGISANGKYAGKARVESSAGRVRINISAPMAQPATATDADGEQVPQQTWEPTIVMEKLSKLLEKVGQPISFRNIKQAMTGKDDTLRKAIELLHQRGFIDIQPGPRGALLHVHLRPYRADQNASVSHRVPSVSLGESGHGEERVSDRVPNPTPLSGGGGHGTHSRPPEETVPDPHRVPEVNQDTVLEIPEGFSHCNQCGQLASETEIELNNGYCDSCQED